MPGTTDWATQAAAGSIVPEKTDGAAAATAADSMIPTAVDGEAAAVGVHLPYRLPEAFHLHPHLAKGYAWEVGVVVMFPHLQKLALVASTLSFLVSPFVFSCFRCVLFFFPLFLPSPFSLEPATIRIL